MENLLRIAIKDYALKARQVLLPNNVSPRLSAAELPLADLMDTEFLDSIFVTHQHIHAKLRFFHSTAKKAAKILMTPMRDASFAGPALRDAHRRVGQYLAIEYLTDIVGIEEYQTQHVQGHLTPGFRFCHESQTLIVALMRGGEPMALGVNEALPLAAFLHATQPSDVEEELIQSKITVILVDSVINSGKTIVKFLEHILSLHKTVRIVIVAGVVQSEFMSKNSPVQGLIHTADINLVALRLSENKFKGQGGTDTGNRLFNTTELA